jgi:hypothetical protein
MTRDEHRNACIEAMEEAFHKRTAGDPTSIYNCMIAAFDALGQIAVVIARHGFERWDNELTNPPEEKP